MSNPHINELRSALMDTLKDLRDRENPMDVKRAMAVAQVATVLVETARVENDYLKLTGQDRSAFLEQPADAHVAQLGTTVMPGDRNGITSIVTHKLRG